MYRRLASFLLLAVGLSACINIFSKVDVREIDANEQPRSFSSPVKAHLTNGDVAIFEYGAALREDTLRGEGKLYPLNVLDAIPSSADSLLGRPEPVGTVISAVPLRDVAAFETFKQGSRPVETVMVSTLATAVGTLGSIVLLKAIFGSCPTIYSGHDDAVVLESEMFPNSIASLFEMRDVDRLSVMPDKGGRVSLDVRNEALETHYINYMELIEVQHEPDGFAVPSRDGGVVVLHDLSPPRAVDQTGRDVTTILSQADDRVYETSSAVLSSVDAGQFFDTINLSIRAPKSDTAAIYLRLRNSLLGTVFFYDFMLAGQGPGAIDWIGQDLEVIGEALSMADFYSTRMGLRVQVWKDGSFHQVGRVREVGPIAFDHVAVPFSVPPGDSLRLRLQFVADSWRIDQLAIAAHVTNGTTRNIPLSNITAPTEALESAYLAGLAEPDEEYAITGPGDRFWIHFEPGRVAELGSRSYFLAAQGYYTEWIRGDWVRSNPVGRAFEPSDETLLAALHKWKIEKADFEQRFYSSKVPLAKNPCEDC